MMNKLCMCGGFLDCLRDWHVNHPLVGVLLDVLMINRLCMFGGFFGNSRD